MILAPRADYAGTMTDTTPLAAGFPTVDRGAWRDLVVTALAKSRGPVAPEDAERLLATPTDDGYSLRGLYTAADLTGYPEPAEPGLVDYIRGARAADDSIDWGIRQRHWVDADTPAAVADDLANGATSLWLTDGGPEHLATVLAGIDLAAVPVVVEGFRSGAGLARALLEAGQTLNPASSLGLDPIGLVAATTRGGDVDDAMDLAADALAAGIKAFTIDGTTYHDAGASFAEELGAVTAAGLATLRLMVDSGIPVDQAARLLEFRWIVTDDQFASIAKLRAARVMWSRVLDVAGVGDGAGQRQHAATSVAMLTSRDPWVNLIRNCVAAFAGGVGGADAVTVEPHSLVSGSVDELARRMARNTQLLLLQESHVGFVVDPAGGSYYVETRTRQLAEAGWAWLQEIEGAGGMRSALDSGLIAKRLDRTWGLRAGRTAQRKAVVTGVTEFPDRERRSAPVQGWQRPGGGLPQHRHAEAFEALRDRADAAPAEPTVALLTLGPLAKHAARETYAQNLFAAGGVATVSVPFEAGTGLELPLGVKVVCVCGTDADYDDLIEQIGPAARQAGAVRVLVAGKPGARADKDAAAGVDKHIYVGCDALAVLEQTLSDLEVPA